MRVALIFEDWQDPNGVSIYSTEEGVELSMGDLHSGSTFYAELEVDEDTAEELHRANASGCKAIFRVVPD